MSELAERERVVKRSWAKPGSFHDVLIRFLKIVLPLAIGVLLAYLALSPLQKDRETSFLLDKNKVDTAAERMRVEAAEYRGRDDRGRPFTIEAARAVQATSTEPIVDINGMSARIGLNEGPATLRADRGRYDLTEQTVDVLGPIMFTAADGYRLRTSDVSVDFNKQALASDGRVRGEMPLGTFSADRMTADLADQRVVLSGRARLHIRQGGLK